MTASEASKNDCVLIAAFRAAEAGKSRPSTTTENTTLVSRITNLHTKCNHITNDKMQPSFTYNLQMIKKYYKKSGRRLTSPSITAASSSRWRAASNSVIEISACSSEHTNLRLGGWTQCGKDSILLSRNPFRRFPHHDGRLRETIQDLLWNII